MCVHVIYKCLKFETLISSNSWASQTENSQAKTPVWGAVQASPKPNGEKEDSVCIERGARMDSFATVLTMPYHFALAQDSIGPVKKNFLYEGRKA
jgi:hypothetical protein